jgi:hypothetical protein
MALVLDNANEGGRKRGRIIHYERSSAMRERDQSRLASVLTLLVGIWVAISPIWISVSGGALVSVIATGVVIALFSLVQYFWENALPSWIMGLAAVWLFVSAFVFSSNVISGGAMVNQILSAVAAFALAYWDGIEITHVHELHEQRHAAM